MTGVQPLPDPDRRLTLMTVHAHPDDEVVGTGGTMAKYAAEGDRVVLVTCTRGELGEIVAPQLDSPDNHRRLGELRAVELEAAMEALGVTEWESLGYRDSGMMGTPGNQDPRCFWQAPIDDAIRRLVWLVRRHRPDVMTTYNDFGGYGHPDHIRTHQVAIGAFSRAGDPDWYREQLTPEHGGTNPSIQAGGLEPWSPSKLYEQAIPASVRTAMQERLEAMGQRGLWSPPENATADELVEHEAYVAKMLVPDEAITTRIDIADHLDAKWEAIQRHVTQISLENPFMAFGIEGWREFWSVESFILRESRAPASTPETDLFAGLR